MAQSGKKVPVIIDFSVLDNVSEPLKRVSRRLETTMAPINRFQNSLNRFGRATGITKLAGAFSKFGKNLASVGNEVFNLGLKLAGLGFVGFKAFQGLIQGPIKAQTGLLRISERLGLSVEQLQQWRFVAEQAGVSAEHMDQSFEEFAKRVGEAATGTGELVSIFGTDDPFLTTLLSIENMGDAMEFFIDRASTIKDATKLQLLFDKAFGGTGRSLINLTKLSDKDRKAQLARARSIKFVTQEQAEAFAETEKNFLALGTSLNNVFIRQLSKVIPMIDDLISKFGKFFEENQGRIGGFVDRLLKFLPAVDGVDSSLSDLLDTVDRFITFLEKVDKEIGVVKAGLIAMGLILAGPLLAAIGSLMVATVALIAVFGATPIGWALILVGLAGELVIHWEKIKGIIDWIANKVADISPDFLINAVGAIDRFFGGSQQLGPTALNQAYPAASTIPQVSESKVQIDANFQNVPRGTRISQQTFGNVQFDLNYGFALPSME